MFIEKLKPTDCGEPIYERKTIGCAPKGVVRPQLVLPFYKHFTAKRFSRHTRSRVLGYFRRGLNVIRLFSVVSIFAQDRMAIEFIEDF